MPLRRDGQAVDGAPVIGRSIRSLRRRRGWTLAQLASAAELDTGYLSRVERGEKQPSVTTLLKIAEALNVQVGHLFGDNTTEEAISVTRADQHGAIRGGGGAVLQAIFPASDKRRLSAFVLEAGAAASPIGAGHPGEEMIYVLEGVLEISFPDRRIELGAGDCIHFDGYLRHDLRALGNERSRVLIIVADDLSPPDVR